MTENERRGREAFESLLAEYWELAYDEGKTGCSHGSRANEVLASIRASLSASTPSAVPAEVLAALDRMCTPLDESWLKGATAEADAHCMKLIRDYVLCTPPADKHTLMAAEYQRWIDFYHAGNGDYADFMRADNKENGNGG